ncbi:acyltransferase [Agitococcus lubricus]|uniref:1-acyl-sn-glycerol-3-phosphate acyltransferase n=1 Tax=Agitococcus lubricus TaxID=1077255 RepID=A0A2T5IWK7_9GAMM|nr:acyltransferase [Agitococcus lubricus]PTQ88293.1 1-acyl-sn-glycerol-3-phosphate acyltransferase [Agitococcus lubricus]
MEPDLPKKIIGSSRLAILIASTVVHSAAIMSQYPLKLVLPKPLYNRFTHPLIFKFAEHWTKVNNLFIEHLPDIELDIQLPEDIRYDGNYFIIANHQTWVDIVVLQYVFYRKTTFIRFFTKQELAYLPFLGQALYVMDFPYMKRYSKELLAKHPHLQGKDLETTRESCAKIQENPYAILNFLEGTRFTSHKHQQQQSPYRHLLKPKSGGMAFALRALGSDIKELVDVTVYYPEGAPRFIDFWSGKTKTIKVSAKLRPIPPEFTQGDYEHDTAFRERFQTWINQLWQEKDTLLATWHAEINKKTDTHE